MQALARTLALAASLLQGAEAMADWTMQREETFASGAALDPAFWTHETGLHRNREEQSYQPGNVTVQGGVLRIEGRRERVPNAQWRPGAPASDWRRSRREATYTSGSIVSREPLQYGRIEVVARSPSGAGVWPAIWLLHESEGLYGEIDVFEAVGKHPDTAFAGVHWGREPRTRQHRNDSRVVPGLEGNWHTHVVEWTPDRITVSLDGQPWFSFDPREARLDDGRLPLREPMRLRINLALGGSWAGPIDAASLPAAFEIRSVRIWRWTPGSTGAPPEPAAQGAQPPVTTPPAAAAGAAAERTQAPMRWGR